MRALFAKIKADADRLLEFPLQAGHDEKVQRCLKYLRRQTVRLRMLHREGGGGQQVCRARAEVLDLLFVKLLEAARSSHEGRDGRYALVAVGGYGRAELNPFSDMDIMFLHQGGGLSGKKELPFTELLGGGLLWDVGLKIGHSVRSVADCVTVANSDMRSKTALLEARFVWGDQALFEEMRKALLARCVRGREEDYIQARIEDQAARRAKYGNSVCLQEPNIKNGCGGLRDHQNLLWMAFVKYGCRTMADLEARKLIIAPERRQLEAAYDFLLRVRTELHYQEDRATDVLTKNVQPAVANQLGYRERSPSRRLERFMRAYYLHCRNIHLITRTLEQRLALLPRTRLLPGLRRLWRLARPAKSYALDGFKFTERDIRAASDDVFEADPRRLMRVFRYAQQRGADLHPDLVGLIRRQLRFADSSLRSDPHARQTFLEILGQRGNVAATLRQMHQVGLLGRYVPAFGRLTCLVQHEFFHQYSADEHTLVCLEKLDQLQGAQSPGLAPYAVIFQRLQQPYILYLALLLHDSGKGRRCRDHVQQSVRFALETARKLALDQDATRTLESIIQHHLDMIVVSQRRNLDDPAEIRRFAALVQTPQNLDLLLLHTLADSLGTSDQLWNGFKDALLWALYRRTNAVLTGAAESAQAEAKRRDELAGQVAEIAPRIIHADEFEAHFASLPDRYFYLRSPREILVDVVLAHRFILRQLDESQNPSEPVIAFKHEPDRGYSMLKICTWDCHGLFAKIAGALTAAGLNILSAEIFTRSDHIVLDTFYVTDPSTGGPAGKEERHQFERLFRQALTADLDLSAPIVRRKSPPPLYRGYAGESIPTVVRFHNDASDTHTILDLQAEDRVGLLYTVVQTLSELSLDISLARICTERGAAMDSFYVREVGGGKVLDPDRREQIEQRLSHALRMLEEHARKRANPGRK